MCPNTWLTRKQLRNLFIATDSEKGKRAVGWGVGVAFAFDTFIFLEINPIHRTRATLVIEKSVLTARVVPEWLLRDNRDRAM